MGFDILCLFYSEFNTEKGAEIIIQLPKDYIKLDEFVAISEFVIPRTELCDKLVSLKLGKSYLIGYPIHLKNPGYERAKFQFNFCILIPEEEYEKNYFLYELLLKKIGKTFESIEIDGEYDFIRRNRDVIISFVEKLYFAMVNKKDVISITFEGRFNDIFHFYFKYVDYSNAKHEILQYQVPVWTRCLESSELKYFENRVKRIIENIDGLTYVKKLAMKVDCEVNFVSYIFCNLLLIDSISMVDIFQFTNIYRATVHMRNFNKKGILEDLLNFVRINVAFSKTEGKFKQIMDVYLDDEAIAKAEYLNDSILFSLFCELANSLDVADFISRVNTYGLNIPLFIAYGVHKKIIKRVHAYCIYNSSNKENIDMRDQDSTELLNKFLLLLDGKHCLDEICCEIDKSPKEVNGLITTYFKNSNILYK